MTSSILARDLSIWEQMVVRDGSKSFLMTFPNAGE